MSAMRRLLLITALVVTSAAAPAYASRDGGDGSRDRPRCSCQHQQWDDRYYDGPYCEGPPPTYQDEQPRCGGDDGYEPANTPTTRPSTTTTTRKADVAASTTSTTTQPVEIAPPTTMIRPIIHEDPKPEVKAITIDRTEVTKPAPLQELPRTGGTDGALLGGFFLMLGGASIMLGGRAAGNDWRRTT